MPAEFVLKIRRALTRESKTQTSDIAPWLKGIQERHGLPLMNAETPSPAVVTLLKMSERGAVATEEVPGLEGYTVIPRWRIVVTEKGREAGVTTPFNGHFIGEEYHGGSHPLLIIPPDRVKKLREQ